MHFAIVEILKIECNNRTYCLRITFKALIKFFTFTLREISQNMGFLLPVFSRTWTESHQYFPCMDRIIESTILSLYGKMGTRFCSYTRKYGHRQSPHFGIHHAMSNNQRIFSQSCYTP